MKKLILAATILACSSALASHWGEYRTLDDAQEILSVCQDQLRTLDRAELEFVFGEFLGGAMPFGPVSTTHKLLFADQQPTQTINATLIISEKIFSPVDDTQMGSSTEWKCEIKKGNQINNYVDRD